MSRFRIHHQDHMMLVDLSPHQSGWMATIEDKTCIFEILVCQIPHIVIRWEDGRITNACVSQQGETLIMDVGDASLTMEGSETWGQSRMHHDQHPDIKSPMPGRVVSIQKKVGDVVERGEPVIVVEAMKMQNALTAPTAGTITIIHVQPGDKVEAQQILISF